MELKIAITGCGPAGLACALMLANDGHDIVIYERFDTPRPVGSGLILQPTGLSVLQDLGLSDAIHSRGSRIDRIHGISTPTGKTVLNVNYRVLGENLHGVAVHRAALFEVLYKEVISAGVEIVTGVEVENATINGTQIQMLTAEGTVFGPFDLVIDASGASSKLRKHSPYPTPVRELTYGALWGSFDWPGSGFDQNTLEQRYVGAHTMIGVLPIGQHSEISNDQVAFFWSIKAENYGRWLENGLDKWKEHVLSIWPETVVILDQIENMSQMQLASYGHSTMRQPYGEGIVFLGDAAHSTSPQLGQGANMALLDSWCFARALRDSGNVGASASRYAAMRRWHVRAFQLSSLALTPFYQSDSRAFAALRDLLFDPVSKLPVVRRIVVGLVTGLLAGPPKDIVR